MSLRHEIIETFQALANKNGCKLAEAPTATQKWLSGMQGLHPDVIEILSHSWPDQTMRIGAYDLWTCKDLSDSERAKLAIEAGYFMIGGAGNGDLLVLKRQPDTVENCEIGLISHEELWEKKSQLDTIYEPVCRGFLNLLKSAQVEGAFPLDFYESRRRRLQP